MVMAASPRRIPEAGAQQQPTEYARRANSAGGTLPRLLCGRCSLYARRQDSIFSRASDSVKNQCSFRHSWRNRALNDSINALSVGLPGRLKSSVTPFQYAHRSRCFETNSGPLSTRIEAGRPCRSTTCSSTRTVRMAEAAVDEQGLIPAVLQGARQRQERAGQFVTGRRAGYQDVRENGDDTGESPLGPPADGVGILGVPPLVSESSRRTVRLSRPPRVNGRPGT